MRVEHTGFPLINLQQFGSYFRNSVANVNEILVFYKKKSAVAEKKRNGKNDVEDLEDDDGDVEEVNDELAEVSAPEQITRICERILKQKKEKYSLGVLSDSLMHEAVEEYVVKVCGWVQNVVRLIMSRH